MFNGDDEAELRLSFAECFQPCQQSTFMYSRYENGRIFTNVLQPAASLPVVFASRKLLRGCLAMIWRRELYMSPNGDRWCLVRDDAQGRPFILHEPNSASGGPAVELDVGSFLVASGYGPEHQELLRLIGTLADEDDGREKPAEPLHSQWEPAGRV